jgi:hypothetical protein
MQPIKPPRICQAHFSDPLGMGRDMVTRLAAVCRLPTVDILRSPMQSFHQ